MAARRNGLLSDCPVEPPAPGVPVASYFNYLQQLETASQAAFAEGNLDVAFIATKRATNVVLHTLSAHPGIQAPQCAVAWAAAKMGARRNFELLKAITTAMDREEEAKLSGAAEAELEAAKEAVPSAHAREDDSKHPEAAEAGSGAGKEAVPPAHAAEPFAVSRQAAFDFLRPDPTTAGAAGAGLAPEAPAAAGATGASVAVASTAALPGSAGDEGIQHKASTAADPSAGDMHAGPGFPVPRAKWDGDAVRDCVACSTPFSMFIRRHHCRACGCSTCTKCSAAKVRLPSRFGFGAEKVRVCSMCVAVLKAEEREAKECAAAAEVEANKEAARLATMRLAEDEWQASKEQNQQWQSAVQAAAAESAAAADASSKARDEEKGGGAAHPLPASAAPPATLTAAPASLPKSPKSPAPAAAPVTRECSVCFGDKLLVVIAPCGHKSICQDCFDILKAAGDPCPICRQPIEACIARVYSGGS